MENLRSLELNFEEFLLLLRSNNKKRGSMSFFLTLHDNRNINLFLDDMGEDYVMWRKNQTTKMLSDNELKMLEKYIKTIDSNYILL